MFQPINNRLTFFFPTNAFVYLETQKQRGASFSGKTRYALDNALTNAGMQLAFPPDFSKRLNISEQDGAAYWEYHFPGLRSLHLRKQQILLDEVLRGFDLGLAAKLILRKLNLPDNGNHLLYFDAEGITWHTKVADSLEAARIMLQTAATGFDAFFPLQTNNLNGDTGFTLEPPSTRIEDKPEERLGPKVKFSRKIKPSNQPEEQQSYAADDGSLAADSTFQEAEYEDNLLLSLEAGWQRFLHERDAEVPADLREDPEVLRTLLVIRQTESEQGFFKIMAALLSQRGGLDRNQQKQLNPVIAPYMLPPDGTFWKFSLNRYNLSVHFPDLWLDIRLQPLQYAVYQLFLQHPEGIRLKEIRIYRDVLFQNYRAIKATDNPDMVAEQIDRITDPLNAEGLMQCISNVKRRFLKDIGEDAMQPYIIKRTERNTPHRIEAASAYLE
ncbi:MAG: hypothetical protein KJS92_01070 [Bacteroidetes bacterium]|nr:hypothetical protein [Bacteroidota bacterium]